MSVGVASIKTALARLSATALALPVLLGGGAAPAVVAHVMTPSVGSPGQSWPLGDEQDLVAGQATCPMPPPGRPQIPLCYGPAQLRAAYDIQPLIDGFDWLTSEQKQGIFSANAKRVFRI